MIVLSLVADTEVVRRLFVASALGIIAVVVPLDAFFQSERKFGYMAAFRIIFNALNLGIVLLGLIHPRGMGICGASGVATMEPGVLRVEAEETFYSSILTGVWKAALFLEKNRSHFWGQ